VKFPFTSTKIYSGNGKGEIMTKNLRSSRFYLFFLLIFFVCLFIFSNIYAATAKIPDVKQSHENVLSTQNEKRINEIETKIEILKKDFL